MGNFIIRDRIKFGEAFQKGGRGSFCSETFYNSFENLIQIPKKKHRKSKGKRGKTGPIKYYWWEEKTSTESEKL